MLRIVVSPRFPLLVRSLATHAATTAPTPVSASPTRYDWTKEEVQRIYDSPLLDLVFRAASVHRQHHDPSKVQLCTLMNIKSKWLFSTARNAPRRGKSDISYLLAGGGCSEDCEENGLIDASRDRAYDVQAHTARNRLDTQPRRRLPVSLKLSPF
jgi:hypothetical protein